MDPYEFLSAPESLGGHVHFSVAMCGVTQHVFVSTSLVESDADRLLLSRGDAARYVTAHRRRFVDAARSKMGQGPPGPITLDQGDAIASAPLVGGGEERSRR